MASFFSQGCGMSLHCVLNVLLVVVCALAQPQQPLHSLVEHPEVSHATPRTFYEDVASQASGGGQSDTQDDQTRSTHRESALDTAGNSADNNVPPHYPFLSFHTSKQLSTDSRSDKLKSLYSSIRNVFSANSLLEKWHNRVQQVSSLSQQSSVNPSISEGSLRQTPDYIFVENSVAGPPKKGHELTQSAASVGTVTKTIDNHDVQTLSPSNQGSVNLSSLLRDTFLERNPTMMPGHFEKNGEMAEDQRVAEANNDVSSHEQQTSSLISKRDKEENVLPGNNMAPTHPESSQQYAQNDTALTVQERSWRCSIPDVLVGDGELPWTCRQRWAWRFLGEHVYPSRLYEAVCEGRTCWYGHFNCTPITYTLHVLEVCLHGCHDQRVPFPLRSLWQWTDLNVTVGCQCVR